MNSVFRTVRENTSAGDMGFAGAAGLFASGLTDIASSLGPFLPWFCGIAAALVALLAVMIRRQAKAADASAGGTARLRAYSQTFVVFLGSLFGSVVLLISGAFAGATSGSNIIAILNEIQSGVERVEEQVVEIGEDVEGLGEAVSIRDITGRSGTGKIGDKAVYRVALANERRMQDTTCRLKLASEWQDRVSVIDDDCANFTVQLPSSPLLDANGQSMGDVVPVPFEIEVLDGDGDVIASYANAYPIHNNYGTISILLDPPGNRFTVDEERRIRVDVGDAELPDTVECEWTVFDPVRITPTSPNRCEGELSTAVDRDAYVYRRLVEEGEIRDQIYVQINTAADFSMLGNATLGFAVRP